MTRTTHRSRTVLLAACALAAIQPLSCSSDGPMEPLGSAQAAMINGTPVADPPASGYVFIKSTKLNSSGEFDLQLGTGTLLRNDWVLTAAHVVNDAPSPSMIRVRRGNELDPNAEERNGARVAIHHLYDPTVAPSFTVDIALLQLDQPFTGTFQNELSSDSTQDIISQVLTDCYGYGSRSCDGPVGRLDMGSFVMDPWSSYAGFELDQSVTGSAIMWTGDSGGPCVSPFTGEIFGVEVSSTCSGGYPAFVVSAESFRGWVPVVMNAIWSVRADFDGDGALDTGAISYNAANGTYTMTYLYANGTQTDVSFPIGLLPPPVSVRAVAGNFNNDAFGDFLFLTGGVPYSFVGNSALGFAPQAGFVPAASTTYQDLVVQDFNGDGFDDVEAVVGDDQSDLYYGGPNGLGPARPTWGFPSTSRKDGRFSTLTGVGFETVQRQLASFLIEVPAAQTDVEVQVFDGNLGGVNDNGDATGLRTCYDLFPLVIDAGGNETRATRLVRAASDTLPDNAWKRIYFGLTASTTPSFSGAHFYALDAYLVNGDCDTGTSVTSPYLDSFKVRSTGQVSVYDFDFSILGVDAAGDNLGTPQTPALDTTYDGTFWFWPWVSAQDIDMELLDADADVRVDDEPDGTPRGLYDIKADGVAAGANDTIQYSLFAPTIADALVVNTNPSGNNEGFGPIQDVEQISVPFANYGVTNPEGYWLWYWEHVYTENNIRLFVPRASPARYQTYTRPTKRLSPSSALPIERWRSGSLAIGGQLPVTLGSGPEALVVDRVREALSILRDHARSGCAPHEDSVFCDDPRGMRRWARLSERWGMPWHPSHGAHAKHLEAMTRFIQELLVAKLNVARAAKLGENLPKALIYGRPIEVGDVIAQADSALADGDSICRSKVDWAKLADLTRMLRATNQGDVTYWRPTERSPVNVSPAAAVATATAAIVSAPRY